MSLPSSCEHLTLEKVARFRSAYIHGSPYAINKPIDIKQQKRRVQGGLRYGEYGWELGYDVTTHYQSEEPSKGKNVFKVKKVSLQKRLKEPGNVLEDSENSEWLDFGIVPVSSVNPTDSHIDMTQNILHRETRTSLNLEAREFITSSSTAIFRGTETIWP
ncbi:hypothetical protein UY3_01393 [Chelonia mydas]|uniref:Uncharacterized protein n=1 Tax=Chelonia mydas TaxID=8469 RepID=M7CK12_CHEMY|nr:hypothetical protein UY3_01393 [Chelonia mydas]